MTPTTLGATLEDALPRLSLAMRPTPVVHLEALSRELGVELWVKRDDRSGRPYGGNKVRKLELLLASARDARTQHLITFGGIGSNHVVATALYGRELGLGTTAVVFPQPLTPHVRYNLRVGLAAGVRYHPIRSPLLVPIGGLAAWTRHRRAGERTLVIPPGGSSPVGAAGLVLAGLELAAQIQRGELPEPDDLFVPLGSNGTAAGLAVGLAAAGLATRVHAVRVVDRYVANRTLALRLAHQTAAWIRRRAPGFPAADPGDRFTVVHDQFGRAYGHETHAGNAAVTLARDVAGLQLEGTYSGKAFAALLAAARGGSLRGKRVLFWLTANSRDLSELAARGDPRALPEPIRGQYHRADHTPSRS